MEIEVFGATGEFSTGKAQPLDCKVLTPTGWTTMGEVHPGDSIVNPSGGTTIVKAVFPQGKKPVFRVRFSDGAETRCCNDHLWLVQDINHRNRKQRGKVVSTGDLRQILPGKRWIPLVEPVSFNAHCDLPIDPYVLGVLIGDGGLTKGIYLSNPEPEIREKVQSRLPAELALFATAAGSNLDFRITTGIQGGVDYERNQILNELRKLGLHGKKSVDKFIPQVYLTASTWDRLELLHGLCDTDGSASPGACEYSTSSEKLACDVRELVWSLGGTVTINDRIPKFTYRGERKTGAKSYRLWIRLPHGINPFFLSRKAEICDEPRGRVNPTRRIESIEPIGEAECQCLLIDSEDHTYVTDDYVVTHNTILGLSIAPGAHPINHAFAGQPRTLYLDLEKSGTSYGGTGCQRIDVPAEMTKALGAKWTARQVAEWFNSVPGRVQPGQYDVCVVDPINDIESGEVDLVKSKPDDYGYTKAQMDRSVPLLMAAMKAHYKKLLMGFAGVFKCLYFTVHLRDEFKGGSPTGRREPRGKETLAELASLYLWLERLPDDKGKTSAVPSAIVMKHRLSDTRVNEAGELEIVELMPRRIPVATVQAIRQYIANPPCIERPAAGESVVEKEVTEIELQRMRLATAEAQAAANVQQAWLIDRQMELAAIRRQTTITTSAAPPSDMAKINQEIAAKQADGAKLAATTPPEDKPAMPNPTQRPSASGVASTTMAAPSSADPDRVARFNTLLSTSGIEPEKLRMAMLKYGASRFTQLTPEYQDALLAAMQKAADAKAAAAKN